MPRSDESTGDGFRSILSENRANVVDNLHFETLQESKKTHITE